MKKIYRHKSGVKATPKIDKLEARLFQSYAGALEKLQTEHLILKELDKATEGHIEGMKSMEKELGSVKEEGEGAGRGARSERRANTFLTS